MLLLYVSTKADTKPSPICEPTTDGWNVFKRRAYLNVLPNVSDV